MSITFNMNMFSNSNVHLAFSFYFPSRNPVMLLTCKSELLCSSTILLNNIWFLWKMENLKNTLVF